MRREAQTPKGSPSHSHRGSGCPQLEYILSICIRLNNVCPYCFSKRFTYSSSAYFFTSRYQYQVKFRHQHM